MMFAACYDQTNVTIDPYRKTRLQREQSHTCHFCHKSLNIMDNDIYMMPRDYVENEGVVSDGSLRSHVIKIASMLDLLAPGNENIFICKRCSFRSLWFLYRTEDEWIDRENSEPEAGNRKFWVMFREMNHASGFRRLFIQVYLIWYLWKNRRK